MREYRFLGRVSPELLAKADHGLTRVHWQRLNQDPEQGFIDLQGTFGSRQEAESELARAFDLEDISELGINFLTDPNDILGGALKLSQQGMVVIPPGGVSYEPTAILAELQQPTTTPIAPATPSTPPATPSTPPATPSTPPATPSTPPATASAPPAATTGPKPAAKPPASEMAQNISAGLRAIDGFEKLWSFTEPADKAALAREVLSNLYRDRSAYARSIRWTFSPDAELWDHVGGQRSALAADVLKTRHGLNEHQLALAAQAVELRRADVAIRQEAAKFAAQDVQIRTESVSQQQVVTDMLKEFLEHLRTWRKLADTGKKLLWVTTLLSFGALAAILVMAWEDKLDDWAVPVVVFALALFAISPAVLLILGRPLKGLDEWKPGNTSSQPDSPESGSSQGETPSSDAASSTVAYGETNQPKAYGPTGRLRT